MKKSLLLFFVVLCFLQFSAQEKRKLIDHIDAIYADFDQEISQYDFKKDPLQYQQGILAAQEIKEAKLKKIYEEIFGEDHLLAKKFLQETVDVKDSARILPEVAKDPLVYIKISKNEMEEAKAISIQKLATVRSELAKNFPTKYIANSPFALDFYRVELFFTVDIDGKIKRIKPKGSDREFNYLSALYFYSLNFNVTPLMFKNELFPNSYMIPLKFNLE